MLRRSYYPNMVKKLRPRQKDFKHTWFLQEWMGQCLPPKRQADLINELGWPKAKASDVWNGQQYTQAMIDELAPWLNARPFELLLHPQEAMGLRRQREAALAIVQTPEPAKAPVEVQSAKPARRRA